ncbi:MAG: hypothetical protein GY927_16685, partial [bacterium]|nr:hypothetical protein [bacterium]
MTRHLLFLPQKQVAPQTHLSSAVSSKGALVQQSEIEKKLSLLDGRGSGAEYDAIESLNELGDRLPELLLEKYRHSKKWGERISCVYHAIKYAKANKAAYQLGIEAI